MTNHRICRLASPAESQTSDCRYLAPACSIPQRQITICLLQTFLQGGNVADVIETAALQNRDTIRCWLQTNVARIKLASATGCPQNLQFTQEKQTVGSDENLNTASAQIHDSVCNLLDQARIQIGFRLIPKQIALIEQSAGGNQAGQNAQFAQTLGEKRHFHSSAGCVQVKTSILLQLDVALHRIFKRCQQILNVFFLWSARQQASEQHAGVKPGFLEFQIMPLIDRNKVRVDRQQFTRRQVSRGSPQPLRRQTLDTDL